MPQMEAAVKTAEDELKKALAENSRNLPLAEVPDGADEHGNVLHHVFGAKAQLRLCDQAA